MIINPVLTMNLNFDGFLTLEAGEGKQKSSNKKVGVVGGVPFPSQTHRLQLESDCFQYENHHLQQENEHLQ